MAEFRVRYSTILILLSVLIFSGMIIVGVNGDGKTTSKEGGTTEQAPSFVERAIGFTDVANRMQSVKSWIKLTWLNLRSPASRHANAGSSPTSGSASGTVKEAATESFKTSKETVENAAASAAKAAGEAAQKTKEKVKETAYVETEL